MPRFPALCAGALSPAAASISFYFYECQRTVPGVIAWERRGLQEMPND